MNLIRSNKKWLRSRVLSQIKKGYPDLYLLFWKKFKEYVSSSSAWWLILIFIIIFSLLFSVINIGLLSIINVDKSTAETIVDERAGNISAIAALTLVIVGFLINNLAEKNSFINYLLFKKCYLYPIIYFTLSTMGYFFILSALRDELSLTLFINAALTGTYLAIFVLGFIGFLFKKIIDFTDRKFLYELSHDELILQVKRNLKVILIREYSKHLYKETVEKRGEFNFMDNSTSEKKEKRLYDINMNRLEKFISKKKNQSSKIFYVYLVLDENITYYDTYLWHEDKPNTEKDKIYLKRSLVLKKPCKEKKDRESARKYFKEKIKILVHNGKYRDLKDYLASYYKLYELEMKYQKIMELFVHNGDITRGIKYEIWMVIDKAIENYSEETLRILISFVKKILELSIQENSLEHFKQYIYFLPDLYSEFHNQREKHGSALKQLQKIYSEEAVMHSIQMIRFAIIIGFNAEKRKDILDRKKISEFYYLALGSFSRLLYLMVKNGDKNQFEKAIKEYKKIKFDFITHKICDKPTLRFDLIGLEIENSDGKNDKKIKTIKEKLIFSNKFEIYERRALHGIKYWILFLYQIDKLTEELTLSFIKLIKDSNMSIKELLEDVLFFRYDNDSYLQKEWIWWDFTERPSRETYHRPGPHNWLIFGFIADQIRENQKLLSTKYLKLLEKFNSEELSKFEYLNDCLTKHVDYFQENFNKWKSILKVDSIEKLKEISDQILLFFAMLKHKSKRSIEKAIASAPLSSGKIEDFRESIERNLKIRPTIRRLFKQLGTTEPVLCNKIKLKLILKNKVEKSIFIDGDNYQDYGLVDIIVNIISKYEDEKFSEIIETSHNRFTGKVALEVLNEAIKKLKSKKITPNAILISYKDTTLFREAKSCYGIKKEAKNPFPSWGTFDGIPIYLTHNSLSEYLENRVLVCDFKKAFKMRYRTHPNSYNKELAIDIEEIRENEAKKILEKDTGKWKKTEDEIELSKEEAINLIKTSVIINVYSTLDFQILDNEAFVIGHI